MHLMVLLYADVCKIYTNSISVGGSYWVVPGFVGLGRWGCGCSLDCVCLKLQGCDRSL
jgi:hypothetical protein